MLKSRQKLGKYRVVQRIGEGGFAKVYRAYDTIEGVQVAIKVPHPRLLTKEALANFKKEVRIAATLDHPNILHIKNAGFIDRYFVIVYPLGERVFSERLASRISTKTGLSYSQQILEAVAYAHRNRIIHCDIKPDNFILFKNDRLRLTDFGIAKIAHKTHALGAAGTGTVGYLAPEQAFGKPTFRSDVFSIALVMYRMFAGALPEWPYEELPNFARLQERYPKEFISFLERCLTVDEKKRPDNAVIMLEAFKRLKPKVLRHQTMAKRKRNGFRSSTTTSKNLKELQRELFQRQFRRILRTESECKKCGGPISEQMKSCPWCGVQQKHYRGPTKFPVRCRRCGRGAKLDWKYCAHCYGPAIGPQSTRHYSDSKYEGHCTKCKGELMPFTKYCPWCKKKVTRRWRFEGSSGRCTRCSSDVLKDFWLFCAWCGKKQTRS